MISISEQETITPKETNRKRSSLVNRIRREIGAHNIVIYEVYEDASKFTDFAGATTVKVLYKKKNLKRIKKELTRTCADMVYTDVRDEEWIQFLLDMGITLCLTKEGLDGNSVTTYSSQWDSEVGDTFIIAVLDKIFSFLGCIVCAFLFVFMLLIIKIKFHGQVFVRQELVGLNGRRFLSSKFRTDYFDTPSQKKRKEKDNEDDESEEENSKDSFFDKMGRFIKKSKIESFPMFWNVLKGDMSIVGAVSPTIEEWSKYEPNHRQRLIRKPGMTGLWQTSGNGRTASAERMLAFDMQYINNRTVKNYFYIIKKSLISIGKASKKAGD